MEGVAIREATEGVYDDILAIRAVYGGRDYLKDCFKSIIKRNRGYVAVLDQQIIGFKFACIVDHGMNLHTRAGRVKEEFEGTSINRMLDEHIRRVYGNSVKYEAVSFHDKNTNLMKKMRNGLLNVVLKRNRLGYVISTQKLRHLETSMEASETVRILSPDDVKYIFSSQILRQQLFPANVMISFWTLLRIMEENVIQIFDENGFVLGSNATRGDDHSRALLSIGHEFTCPLGYICIVDVIGHGEEHVLDHLIIFCKNAFSVMEMETLIVEVYADPLLESVVHEAMMKLGFKVHVWDVASAMHYMHVD